MRGFLVQSRLQLKNLALPVGVITREDWPDCYFDFKLNIMPVFVLLFKHEDDEYWNSNIFSFAANMLLGHRTSFNASILFISLPLLYPFYMAFYI